MKNIWLFLIIICSVLITYLLFIFLQSSYDVIGFSYKVGQIADRDIIAPFTFSVYKSAEAIEKEKEIIASTIDPIYRISDEIKYDIIRRVDLFMETLASVELWEPDLINLNLERRFGFTLEDTALIELANQDKRIQLYDHLIRSLNRILEIGIYSDDIESQAIEMIRNDTLRSFRLERLYSIEESKNKIIEDMPDESLRYILSLILSYFVTENIVVDQERTNRILQEAYQTINPILTEILENEEIIRKNRRVTELDLRKLDALSDAYSDYYSESELSDLLQTIIAYFILALLLILSGYLILTGYVGEHFKDNRHLLVYLLLLILTSLMAFSVAMIPALHILIFPYTMSVLIFSMIFTPLGGFVFNIVSFFLILPFFNWNILDTSVAFLTTVFIIVILTRMKDHHDFIPLSIYLVFSFLVSVSIIAMITSLSGEEYVIYLMYGLISCAVSITGIVLLSPIIEKRLNLATKMILLELLDTNNPVLKRLAIEAPGTFHHSITVGILAESAAEAIGANPLLARVGSYYHDIGKLENPGIFIENNSEASELHEQMEFYESAANIKNHVLEGLSLAKKHKFPQQVIDIIKQHHGDSKVSYFYNKAKEIEKEIDDETAYRYYGPKPQSKEAALVMIADIIESTAKVQMHQHTESSLKKIINDTIQRLILEDQLSEAPITLKELETLKSYIFPIILGIYRKRIEYPEFKADE